MREANSDDVLREVWSGASTSTKVKAQPATDYEVRVAAYNAVGAGTESAALCVSTAHAPAKTVAAARPPGVLAAPHVSVRGGQSAQVSWAAAGNNKFVVEMLNEKLEEDFSVCFSGPGTSCELKVGKTKHIFDCFLLHIFSFGLLHCMLSRLANQTHS
jgi:hypothetical protein